MQSLVLDTNIIVSALWNPKGIPAEILRRCLLLELDLIVSQKIIVEYGSVLQRDKFRRKFTIEEANNLLLLIEKSAIHRNPKESTLPPFSDETDRKFYDLAKAANAYLITGNIKHYPKDNKIISPAEFLVN